MNKCALGVLTVCTCWAQSIGITPSKVGPMMSPNRNSDTSLPSHRWPVGDEDQSAFEAQLVRPEGERPSGESISVAQLRHKVPKEAKQSFARASKLVKTGLHARAAGELETAIARDPEFAEAHHLLGVEYAQVQRYREAEASLRRSLELDPDTWSTHFDLGVVLFRMGDVPGAEQNVRRALRMPQPPPGARRFLDYLSSLLKANSGAAPR